MGKPTILHTEASNGWGGQEIRILAEMLGMKGRGCEVLLATPRHTAIFKRASQAGIRTFDVDMDKSRLISGTVRLAGIIRENNVSIINTHSSRDSWMGAVAGRLAGARVIRTRHISSELRKDPLTRLVYGPLCDAIITTGESIRMQVAGRLGINPEKIHSIPTGVDVKSFDGAKGDAVRSSLGVGGGAAVLGTAAALRSWKGHEFIVMAMPDILRGHPDARLVLAGEGPRRRFIEGVVRELGLEGKVLFLGHREDMPEVIKAFDISLLVSYASEGIPQFLIQSMAAGKPIVGSRVGGIPEVVADGANGLLVPPKDPKPIAAAVNELLSNPGRMREMGEEGRKMAYERHTLEGMLDKVEALYEKVLS